MQKIDQLKEKRIMSSMVDDGDFRFVGTCELDAYSQ